MLFRGSAIIALTCGFATLVAGSALGSSGTILEARASVDWTNGSFAGAVYRTYSCLQLPSLRKPPPSPGLPTDPPSIEIPEYFSPCAWIPYATLGPGDEEGDCSSPERATAGDGVQRVWSGGERTGAGSAVFDLTAVPLQYGADAPLLCLSVIEAGPVPVLCIAVVGFPCPPYAIGARHYQLDSALLEVPSRVSSPSLSSVASGALPLATPSPGMRKPQRKRCRRGKRQARQDVSAKPKRKVRCRSRPRGPGND